MILDHNGEPVSTSALRREDGAATTSGIRSPYRSQQAPGMRPERLARLLRAADDGDTVAFFTVAEEIEERDSHYGSVLGTRKLGVSGAPFNVQSRTDKRRDAKIADDVRTNIIERPEFGSLVFDMLDCLGKGISAVEIIWEFSASQWRPVAYEWRDQRWFVWDERTLTKPLLVTDANPNGEPLAPYKWIIHTPKLKSGIPLRGGLARPACIMYSFKSYTCRDLNAFLESYGIPFRYGTFKAGATEEEQRKLLDAVVNIGSDASGIVPDTTKIEFARVDSKGGSDAYIGTLEYWDKQISKRVLGQTMTTDEGTGRGKAQASEQSKQKLEIKRHDASRVAAAIRQQLITPYVRLNYGEDALIPGLTCETRTDEELDMHVSTIERLVRMGVQVPESYARDLCNIPEPDRDKDGKPVGRLLSFGGSTSNEEPATSDTKPPSGTPAEDDE